MEVDGQERLLRAITAFTDAAVPGGDGVDAVALEVARRLGAAVGVDRCSVHLQDGASGMFRGVAGQHAGRSLGEDITRSRAGGTADGVTAELLETRRPVVVADAAGDPRCVSSTVRHWGIASIMAVPLLAGDDVLGIAFLDDAGRRHDFTAGDVAVAVAVAGLAASALAAARARAELEGRVEAQERRIAALRRAASVDEHLSDLVLEGRSLGELVEAVAKLLGKPVAVHGTDGERLAVAGDEDGLRPRILERPAADHPAVVEALAAGAGSRAHLVGPLPAADLLHRYVVAPVVAGGVLRARLVVMEHRRRFGPGDLLAARRAALLLALQLGTDRYSVEADWNAGASFAAELLGGCPDPELAGRRATALGVRLDAPRLVALVCTREARDARIISLRDVIGAFRDVAPHLLVQGLVTSRGIGVLVERPDDVDSHDFVAAVKDVLHDVLALVRPDGELIAGVSTVRLTAAESRAAYMESQQVIACLRRFSTSQGPAVVTADELGAGRVFLAMSDTEAVLALAESTFGELVDDPGKGDLVVTLCSFFEHLTSTRRVAEHLGVHENTIRYRLRRIERITGLAVAQDPDAQLQARLTLLVLALRGRLPLAASETGIVPTRSARLEVAVPGS